MFQLYARALFSKLSELATSSSNSNNDGNDDESKKNSEPYVEVRFTELYNNKLRDLLSPTKEECFVRETLDGEVFIRSKPIKSEKDGRVRQFPITGIPCKDETKLMKVVREGVKSRNVGISTLHDKSSRSHAILEYEIVNRELMEEKRNLIEIEADVDHFKRQLKHKKKKKAEEKQKKIILKIEKIMKENEMLGGTMVFVDLGLFLFVCCCDTIVFHVVVVVVLAGNEYGRDVAMLDTSSKDEMKEKTEEQIQQEKKQFAQEQKERNQINQSLLALKVKGHILFCFFY